MGKLTRENTCKIQTEKIKAKAVEENIIELNKNLIFNQNTKKITEQDISKMNKLELLEKCKELGITKCSSKTKSQLIELITPTKKKNETNFL